MLARAPGQVTGVDDVGDSAVVFSLWKPCLLSERMYQKTSRFVKYLGGGCE